MDILFLLIPMSIVMMLAIMAVFAWALDRGQFDDIEQQGAAILDAEIVSLDRDQAS